MKNAKAAAPIASPSPKPPAAKARRSDGAEARNRLLDAALALFAQKGFAKTSTREIALTAQVNIASISYYFGDKAGLYRAVFQDPRSNPGPEYALANTAFNSLDEVLRVIFMGFTEPLKQGDRVQSCTRLHFREMLEPTGVWQEVIEHNIRPIHQALVQALCQHLSLSQPNDDIHRLAFSIAGLGMMLHAGSEVIPALCPALLATPKAVDTYGERLQDYALAMVAAETQRRANPVKKTSAKTPPSTPPAKPRKSKP